jgi:predicted MPP superfamily phosphohydrolase
MSRFLFIVFGLFVTSFAWWLWADMYLRRAKAARTWRVLIGAYAIAHAILFVTLIFARTVMTNLSPPTGLVIAVYVWHLVVMPVVLLAFMGDSAVRTIGGTVRSIRARLLPAPALVTTPSQDTSAPRTGPTRRQVLAAAVVAATPPLVECVAVAASVATLDRFRINRMEVAFRGLPMALDGVVIAHLSDTHLGRFTKADDVPRIVDAANRLNADVIAFTGDLIDFDLADLPTGLNLLRGLQPSDKIVVCEGNHDLFQDAEAFRNALSNAGFPLLRDRSRTVNVRGYPLRFTGLSWGASRAFAGPPSLQSMRELVPDDGAFNVLLTHHPDTFDVAADAGANLTLAGHTHGGQLMLTPNLGPGPLMYKYWSGLYRNAAKNAACVVSNGIGNWFPLRFNAPAEIVRITLRAVS